VEQIRQDIEDGGGDTVEKHKFYFGTHRTQLQTHQTSSNTVKGKQQSFCKQPFAVFAVLCLLRAHHDAGLLVSWKPQ
jgi:hypothetical protein